MLTYGIRLAFKTYYFLVCIGLWHPLMMRYFLRLTQVIHVIFLVPIRLIRLYLLIISVFIATTSHAAPPSEKFDLSHWLLTLPSAKGYGEAASFHTKKLRKLSHPYFFYLDPQQRMVFTSPNKGATVSGSINTRSELRQMNRGLDTRQKIDSPKNNFSLKNNRRSYQFHDVGGKLEARLHVDHVALRAGHPNKRSAYSVVVGQVRSGKDSALHASGFGWGNAPLQIYYKKWPNHKKGSIFWTYERNLSHDDPNHAPISYPVWGNTWENPADPGDQGIALKEAFSYQINIYSNTMYLLFKAAKHKTVRYKINLANNINAYQQRDTLDNPEGYSGDWLFFKAGAFNQCNTKDSDHPDHTACPGTRDWGTDVAYGDFTRVSFSRLLLDRAKKMVRKHSVKMEEINSD